MVRVELLVVKDCPHEGPAGAMLRDALDSTGLDDTPVQTVVVTTDAEAQALCFGGSPTFMVDGHDLFEGGPAGLACRVYPTSGGLRGTPDMSALIAALEHVRHDRGRR